MGSPLQKINYLYDRNLVSRLSRERRLLRPLIFIAFAINSFHLEVLKSP